MARSRSDTVRAMSAPSVSPAASRRRTSSVSSWRASSWMSAATRARSASVAATTRSLWSCARLASRASGRTVNRPASAITATHRANGNRYGADEVARAASGVAPMTAISVDWSTRPLAVASVPAGEPLSYYHELDPSFFTASGDTFIGQVYGLFGLDNIADATGEDYPQLSQEFVVEADPDVIFVTSGDFSDSPETISARPGWDEITAVEQGDVVVVDADQASRWGPRVVDFVESVAEALPAVRE